MRLSWDYTGKIRYDLLFSLVRHALSLWLSLLAMEWRDSLHIWICHRSLFIHFLCNNYQNILKWQSYWCCHSLTCLPSCRIGFLIPTYVAVPRHPAKYYILPYFYLSVYLMLKLATWSFKGRDWSFVNILNEFESINNFSSVFSTCRINIIAQDSSVNMNASLGNIFVFEMSLYTGIHQYHCSVLLSQCTCVCSE